MKEIRELGLLESMTCTDDNTMLFEHKKRYLRVAKFVSLILSHDYTCTGGFGAIEMHSYFQLADQSTETRGHQDSQWMLYTQQKNCAFP